MKKIALGLILFNLFIICSGQDSYIKGRLNFKAGYASYAAIRDKKSNFRIESNYGVSNYIEVGVYLGYSSFYTLQKVSPDSIIGGPVRYIENNTLFYGVGTNFHLFPFLVKEDDFRFDLYGTAKAGGLYFQHPYNLFTGRYPIFFTQSTKRILFEYGIGGGFAFYLGKHFGLYTEYTFGKYYMGENHKLRYGLTFKF